MVLNNISTELQVETHRALVEFITNFEPEHNIFAELSQAQLWEMLHFLDFKWVETDDIILDNEARNGRPTYLLNCPKAYRTLTGYLRPRAGQRPAKLQTSLPQTRPYPIGEVLTPYRRLRPEDQQAVENPSPAPDDPHSWTGQQPQQPGNSAIPIKASKL